MPAIVCWTARINSSLLPFDTALFKSRPSRSASISGTAKKLIQRSTSARTSLSSCACVGAFATRIAR